jgi:Sulfotransferase family
MFDASFAHPEFIRREPLRTWSAFATVGVLLKKCIGLALVSVLSLPFWPLYLLLRIFWPRPPILPAPSRTLRCLRLILTERAPEGPNAVMRLALLMEVVRRTMADGFFGFAWLLDEVIWGRRLQRIEIVEPLFEISAARSGSTQLARYLEDDPHLVAPKALQITFPFYWLWRIGPSLEIFLPKDWREKFSQSVLLPEHQERHEVDPLRTDTFEILFLMPFHLGDIFTQLGPRVLADDFCFSRVKDPVRDLWENDFLQFIDRLGRKTLMHAARDATATNHRYFIKGHFLHMASSLAQKYPDARFLTMVRVPEKRFQSLINFLRCQVSVPPNPPLRWSWLVQHACTSEVDYCEVEMAWFQETTGPRRCVVRFDDYVRDLEGTMRRVYRECLDRELSPHVPTTHAARDRSNYSIDRSLSELGIDENALKSRLEAYRTWCKSDAK